MSDVQGYAHYTRLQFDRPHPRVLVSAHLPWVQVDGWLGQRAVDVTPAAAIQGLGDPAP